MIAPAPIASGPSPIPASAGAGAGEGGGGGGAAARLGFLQNFNLGKTRQTPFATGARAAETACAAPPACETVVRTEGVAGAA